MIRAVIFDLDGVLVQTEKLKARAYDLAAQQVLGLKEPDQRASEAYVEVIGASREATSRHVMTRLGLEPKLRELMPQYGVNEPWQALTAIRYQIYDEMVGDPQVLRDNQWPYNVAVLRLAHQAGCLTALTTLSKRRDVDHVISALDIAPMLDLVITAEDVSRAKPDPEIYLLAAQRLSASAAECLVLEDSVNGLQAALAAGMNVVAIATPFTANSIHAAGLVKEAWIVHRPEDALDTVRRRLAELNRATGEGLR